MRFIALASIPLLLVLLCSSSFAVPCQDYRDFGHVIAHVDIPGYVREVVMQGDFAYVLGGGPSPLDVHVVDVSDPFTPVVAGSTGTPGSPMNAVIRGALLYVADNDGLTIVDVSDPSNPAVAGALYLGGDVYDVDVDGPYAFLADADQGLVVVDVSDPLVPALVTVLNLTNDPSSLSVSGNRVYAAAWWLMEVIDVSDPAHPTMIGTYNPPDGYIYDVEADKTTGLAYVKASQELLVMDAADGTPEILGRAWIPGNSSVELQDDLAYVASGDEGLALVDVSAPGAPHTGIFVNTPGVAIACAIDGSLGLVVDSSEGLQVVRINAPPVPEPLGQLELPGVNRAVARQEDRVYLARDEQGLGIVDISDPAVPRLVAELTTPGEATDVAVDTGFAYIAGGSAGLQVVRLTGPQAPVLVAVLGFAGRVGVVRVRDDVAYLGVDGTGLVSVDVSQPAAPFPLDSLYFSSGSVRDLELAEGLAFAAAERLQVVDTSDPASLTLLSTSPGPNAVEVELRDDLAYVGRQGSGPGLIHARFSVVDVIDPALPVVLADMELPLWYPKGLALSGNLALLTEGNHSVCAVDISEPGDPEIPLTLVLGSGVWNLAGSEDVLLAAVDDGLDIYPPQCPAAVTSVVDMASVAPGVGMDISPNPSRGTTNIRFALPAPAMARLDLFDVLGRRVRRIEAALAQGEAELRWDGRDQSGHPVAAGMYQARLSAGGTERTGRIVLLR